MKGKFYGIGVGPGDPELLTLKAQRVLRETEIIFVPVAQLEKRSLALTIVTPYLESEKAIIEVHLPMTQDPTVLGLCWQQAAEQITAQLQLGKVVAFLTLGDPSLYSTYTYLMERIKIASPDTLIETIPGVTSLAASAARLNIPLAEGVDPLLIVPALQDERELRAYLAAKQNLVLMKVSKLFPAIVQILEQEGRLQDAVLVTRCGQPEEKVIWKLQDVVAEKIDYMSLIIVRKGAGQ